MKCLLINLILFVIVDNSVTRTPLFLPQLPAGEYRLSFLGIPNCGSITTNYKIFYNYYLSKKSANTTEVRGNLTMLTQFDDSFTLEFNMAIKDSIGGWKDNAFVYKLPKACSSLNTVMGNVWNSMLDKLGMTNFTCPFPAGVYKSTGMDTNFYMSINVPKTFFYGTYKIRHLITKNKVVYGCFVMVVQVKRPWETD